MHITEYGHVNLLQTTGDFIRLMRGCHILNECCMNIFDWSSRGPNTTYSSPLNFLRFLLV